MITVLFELLFELLGEVALQLVFEMLGELGISSVKRAVKASRTMRDGPVSGSDPTPLLAAIGCLVFGAIAGELSMLLVPHRILPPSRLPGLSLLLSPLCSGWVMHRYGRWQAVRSGNHSRLATFTGGALFAFGLAATRYLLLQSGR